MYARVAIIGILATLACLGACAGATGQADQPNGVMVTGTAEVHGAPDTAYISLGVQTENKDASAAARENAVRNTAVIDAIVKLGIPKADIQTADYSVAPKIDYKASPQVTVGYIVTNEVRVKVRDLTKTGPVIDTALAAGANDFRNLSFAIEDDSQLRMEALAKAARDANAKSKALADALGLKLSNPISVKELSAGSAPAPIIRGVATMEARTSAPTTIAPGENTVSATVSVLYVITGTVRQ